MVTESSCLKIKWSSVIMDARKKGGKEEMHQPTNFSSSSFLLRKR